MLYIATILISLYYLFFKFVESCYYMDNYYRDNYLFEQLNDDDFNIDSFDDDCSTNNDDQYYEGHFDYNYSNKIDKNLTKYFSIN